MATFDYNRANLGAASLSSPITAAATTATVGASDAATFPTAPFYATIMPVGKTPNQLNSEIVQVTANNSGTLGLVRAQRGTTAKAFDAGALVMNGVYIQDLEQAQAVGKSFFSATLASGVYYINDSRVPTTPADGDSIRVVFGSNWTSGTPQLSLNNGTAANIYAGNNLTSGNASTTTNAMVKSGVIYELTYYNGNWYVLNLVANNSITSDNIADNAVTYKKASFTEYSTTEKVIGTWIDGKPLYRKVVNFGALPNATTKSVAHGLSNFRIRNFYGVAVRPSDNITLHLPTVAGSFSNIVTIFITSSSIIIDTMSTDRSALTECYIMLEYTKTTD